MKTTVIIPCIRPERIEDLVARIKMNPEYGAGCVEILVDEDKERIGVTKMVKRMVEKSQHQIVTFLGDDTIPEVGFLFHAFQAMMQLPDGWGMVGLNDQAHDGNHLATHWMADKRLLPLLGGEFFHTGYRHCYCDQELMLRCKAMGKYIWAEKAVITHEHPAITGGKFDVTEYSGYQEENFMHDKVLFEKRRRHGWYQ